MPKPDPTDLRPVHSPLPAMPRYYADAESRRRFTRRIFDASAVDYDRADRLLAFGTGTRYRRQALLRHGLAPGMRVIDVAMGTGLVAREALGIVGARGSVVGVDPSAGMLACAASTGITMARGQAEALPFADASFDFLSLGYALRHLADLERVFREFHRVLKPGARLLILEITRPASRIGTALLRTYLRGVVPALAWLIASSKDTPLLYRYYWDSIEACVPPDRILETLSAAGFAGAVRQTQLGIFSEYTARA